MKLHKLRRAGKRVAVFEQVAQGAPWVQVSEWYEDLDRWGRNKAQGQIELFQARARREAGWHPLEHHDQALWS